MSQRNPKTNELNQVWAQINDLYKRLSVGNVEKEVFAAVTKNKLDFDSHKEEWLNKMVRNPGA